MDGNAAGHADSGTGSKLAPIPLEAIVEYTGSGPWGRYAISGHGNPQELFGPELASGSITQAELTEAYPDGVTYEIWPEGVPRKFGNRHLMMYRVRRGSLALVEEP